MRRFSKKRSFLVVLMFMTAIAAVWLSTGGRNKEEMTGPGAQLSLAPDDETVVFSYFHHGVANLYTASLDGSQLTRLTRDASASHIRPVFSPDGSRILFLAASMDTPQQTLWLMNRDGSGRTQLSPPDMFVTEAVFSPDGTRIYFLEADVQDPRAPFPLHSFQLFAINMDGTDMHKLAASYYISSISADPDGSGLYYIAAKEGKQPFLLYRLVFGSGAVQTIAMPDIDGLQQAVLSPDGRYFAVTGISGERVNASVYEYDLYLIEAATGKMTQVTEMNSYAGEPVFFRRRPLLLFTVNREWPRLPQAGVEVWQTDLDGFGSKRVLFSDGLKKEF